MEHETKNENHQTREEEVANLQCTWMSEIPTKLEKMGQHLLTKLAWRRRSSSSVCLLARAQRGRRWLIYSRLISTGQWLQPVQNVEVSAGQSHQPVLIRPLKISLFSSSPSPSQPFDRAQAFFPLRVREEVLPHFLKFCEDFTHTSALKVCNFFLSCLMVFIICFMLCSLRYL